MGNVVFRDMPTDFKKPGEYVAAEYGGASISGRVFKGDLLIFKKCEAYSSGEFVLIYLEHFERYYCCQLLIDEGGYRFLAGDISLFFQSLVGVNILGRLVELRAAA